MEDDYLLFAGNAYYPSGGAHDFRFRGSLSDCKKWFEDNATSLDGDGYIGNWAHIAHADTMQIILLGSQRTSFERHFINESLEQEIREVVLPVKWYTPDQSDCAG